ncbi:MAG: hypothetical protein QM708_04305 [Propioniciclava sp.]|uniref:hypothetical protein n=1 Tax=Propioniciclava sp. TaxID=2038686 RepID=UPI0039E2CF3F
MLAALGAEVLAADADGKLQDARRAAERLVLASNQQGSLRQQVEAIVLLARICRHSRDADSLRRGRDAAGIGVRLVRTPRLRTDEGLVIATELERAAGLVASGRFGEGWAAARQWCFYPEADLAGWVWTSMGRTPPVLLGRPTRADGGRLGHG